MTFAKFLIYLVANIIWRRIGGKDSAPPFRIPRSKGPIDIPVVAPWQMVVTAWVARKVWAAVGGQVKDSLASSPNMATRQVGSWLPDPPASKESAQTAPAKSAPKISKSAAPVRAPQTWTSTAQPVASTPAPKPAPAPARDHGTRRLDDDAVPGATSPSNAVPTPSADAAPSAYWAADPDSALSPNSTRLTSPFQKARRSFWNGSSK